MLPIAQPPGGLLETSVHEDKGGEEEAVSACAVTQKLQILRVPSLPAKL